MSNGNDMRLYSGNTKPGRRSLDTLVSKLIMVIEEDCLYD